LATPKRHWVAAKLVERRLATPKRHWVAAKLAERRLATPKRHWVAAKLAERRLATPNRHWVAAKLVERRLATPKRHWVAAKHFEESLRQSALSTFHVFLFSTWYVCVDVCCAICGPLFFVVKLVMSGRYVPPHRRSEEGSGGNDFQRLMFDALRRTFVGLANKVTVSNFRTVAVEVFRENVVRGRGLFCQAVINSQQVDPDLTQVFAALVAIVNKEFPSVGLLMLKRLVALWKKLYRRHNWKGVKNVNAFVGHLYCMNVCSEDLVLEIVLAHLMNPKRSDEDVEMAISEIDVVFRVMMSRSAVDFRTNLLEPLRELLADGDQKLSPSASTTVECVLQRIREWEKLRQKQSPMPCELLEIANGMPTPHHLELDEPHDEELHLNIFAADALFDQHEADYDKARRAILGDDWEDELLASAEAIEEIQDENPANLSKENSIAMQEHDRSIKEQVYLIVRSSVRADEMAHKILRNVPSGNEITTAAMIIESCCQEQTYKKTYALLSERLCKTSASFQASFVSAFREKYEAAAQLSEHQIDHVAMIWAHLLRTDSIRWNCLSALQLLTNEPSCRLLIQSLLRNLERTAGITATASRLVNPEISTFLRGLLPEGNVATLQLCVDLYEAMGIETFASRMRSIYHEALEKNRNSQKRSRE
jgi:pre-mRNA-splicing factor CWC22